jgi:hydrogenase 3 maturation protease
MKKTIILCVGNTDRGDDAAGSYIAKHLKPNDKRYVINAGFTPESYTSTIKKIKPDTLIIIDAADMNLKPGDIRVIPLDKIKDTVNISTHNISLYLLVRYIKQYVDKVLLIGVQPGKLTGRMTKSVKENCDKLIGIIEDDKIDTIEEL